MFQLDVMDYILTEGRNSRLYPALVESGLASDAGVMLTVNPVGITWRRRPWSRAEKN